jgi:hypothetical protein
MALQPHNDVVIENVMLTLGTKEFSTALDSITLTPTTTKLRRTAVNGKSKTRVPLPDWALALTYGQDFDDTGLSHELLTKHGQEVDFVLKPLGDEAEITGTVTLEAGAVGGAAKAIAQSTVTLDVNGQPVFAWNTPG